MHEAFRKPGSAALTDVSSSGLYTNLSRLGTCSLRPVSPCRLESAILGFYESKCLILCGKLNTGWQLGINLDALTGWGTELPV